MTGKDYSASITVLLKGAKQELEDAVFDAEVALENPNFKFSSDDKTQCSLLIEELDAKVAKLKSLMKL